MLFVSLVEYFCKFIIRKCKTKGQNPVNCLWSTNNSLLPLFLILVFMLAPRGLEKRFSLGSAGLQPQASARIRKKRKIKNKKGGYLYSKRKTRDYPDKRDYQIITILFMNVGVDRRDFVDNPGLNL